MTYKTNKYKHLNIDLKEWPIYQFTFHQNKYKKELVEIIFNNLVEKFGDELKNELSKCTFAELRRINTIPWKVDPPEEKKFWTDIRKEVLEHDTCDDKEFCYFQLKRIISRYVEEIYGDFKIPTYKFARVFLTYFFNRIFSGLLSGSLLNVFSKRRNLEKRVKVAGYVEEARNLFGKGVLVLLPTHQSNLDSVILGFTLDFKLGIPAFSYGAGLNLFNYEVAAYYMSKLGAYKVDRRKKNSIYFNSLLTFSKYSLLKNVNSVFFPGGTRSRSGEIETNLKTGLMGSLIEAQFDKIANKDNKKIFIVPVVFNYHSVLEAKQLIYSHLKRTGQKSHQSKGSQRGKKTSSTSLLKTFINIFTKKSEFIMSFGKPMDVFGNSVDSNGKSYDYSNNLVNIEDYYRREGELIEDNQRDLVYTKMLAKKVADSYLKHNVVMSSHLLAYSAFECFKKKFDAEEIFDLMKNSEKNSYIDFSQLYEKVEEMVVLLKDKASKKEILLCEDFNLSLTDLINSGIEKLGVFHYEKVLFTDKKNHVKTKDFGVLYYYANRLSFLKSV